MRDEKEILRRCRLNSRMAQKQLYDMYASSLLGVCMRYTANRAEAEDILQEGFLKVFGNIKDFEGRSSLIGWMRRVMINTAITHYHKNLKHRYHHDVDEVKEINTGLSEYADSDFTMEEMMGVIKTLPAGYKMVFNLYAIEGFKHKEIAEKLDIDINTSKSQYSRARKLIQQKLYELKQEAKKKK